MRNLRPPTSPPAFFSELRRVVSAYPGTDREMVLWDQSGLHAADLGSQLGMTVKTGELSSLGVETNGSAMNGEGSRYGGAVAVAMVGIAPTAPAVNFLNSRLAPPNAHLIPRWAWAAAGGLVAIIVGIIFAYHYLDVQQQQADALKGQLDAMSADVVNAQKFVSKVTVARYWHNESDARYLACLRDIDSVIPEDGNTYATSLDIKAPSPPLTGSGFAPTSATAAAQAKMPDMRTLQCTLQGRTPSFDNVTAMESRMRRMPGAFTDIKLGPQTKVPRTNEILFSVTFSYVPPALASNPAQTPGTAAGTSASDDSGGDSGGSPDLPAGSIRSQGSAPAAPTTVAPAPMDVRSLPPVPLTIEMPTTTPAPSASNP
jgi:Tfp pilus assembly protein PilN